MSRDIRCFLFLDFVKFIVRNIGVDQPTRMRVAWRVYVRVRRLGNNIKTSMTNRQKSRRMRDGTNTIREHERFDRTLKS